MKRDYMEKRTTLPEGVTVSYSNKEFVAKGSKGEAKKQLYYPGVEIKVEGSDVLVFAKLVGKKEKMFIGTFFSHVKNLIKGVSEGYIYKLKVCAGHFPMNVSIKGTQLEVKNFLGEKVPRVLKLKEGAKVAIADGIITVDANDKELAGQVAADIELLTRVTNKDRRIFQDGIYIIEKDGREV